MHIRLEHKGTVVHEIESSKIEQDIEIGRSHQCAWQAPNEDKVISSRHARLFRKGDAIWVEDLESSNGTFCLGKRIKRKKLRPGDHLSLGGCVLSVEESADIGVATGVPELAIVSGKGRGQSKELRPPRFTIGSDPESSMVFLDALVSRHHAEILVKDDGSCWIKDLESKNGTSVNGVALRANQERLLKEGDRVSVAHLELVFHDGQTKRYNFKVWVRLGIMAATLVVVGGAYWILQHMKPAAEGYLGAARSAAESRDFAQAKDLLDKAENARGIAAHRLELEDLSRLVTLWESTDKTWRGAQASLEKGDLVNGSRGLGALYALRQEAWTWSPKAVDEKEAALRAKTMLDTLLHVQNSLRVDDTPFQQLVSELDLVKRVLADNAGDLPSYLNKVRADLLDSQAKLELFIAESSELEKALDELESWPPPVKAAVTVLEDTYATSKGMLKRRCELILEPLRFLDASLGYLEKAYGLARQLKFLEATQVDPRLPSTTACALDSRVSVCRQNIDSKFEKMRVQVNQLMYLFREASKVIPESGTGIPAPLLAWSEEDVLEQVFACDSLAMPLPRRSRNAPSGAYDRYLGIEDFFEFLKAVALRQSWNNEPVAPFMTVLFQSESIVSSVENLQAFFQKEDWATQLMPVNVTYAKRSVTSSPSEISKRVKGTAETAWLLEGPLAKRVDDLLSILGERDRIVERMIAKAESSSGRSAIIAAGIAYRLSSDPSKLKVKDAGIEQWIIDRMNENRVLIRDLNTEYDLATPTRQIEIRSAILGNGFPGDSIVRRMWSSRAAIGTY